MNLHFFFFGIRVHLVPDVLQQFVPVCFKGAATERCDPIVYLQSQSNERPGTERCVPAVLLQPGSQVDPAGLVQVQLVLRNQVGAVHTWGVIIIMVMVMIMMVNVFGNQVGVIHSWMA